MELVLSVVAIILSVIAMSRSGDALSRIGILEEEFDGKDFAIKKLQENNEVSDVDKDATSVVRFNAMGEPVTTSSDSVDALSDEENSLTFSDAEDIEYEEDSEVDEYHDSAFVAWVKEDWLLKLGGVLVLMGVLFFLSLAYTAVGPQGKVSIGYLFGAALMVFGFKYIKKNLIGGSAIHVIGAVIVIITTYVARLPAYDLFDSYFAMMLMFLTSLCVSLTSYAYKRQELAHVGLAISGIVPVIVSTGQPNLFGLLCYLLVVTLSVLLLSIVTSWRTLMLWSLVIVCGYSITLLQGDMGTTVVGVKEMVMVTLFGVLFYMTSVVSIVRTKGETGYLDGLIALLNAGFALVWILSKVPHEIAPICIALVGFLYAVGFFVVYKITNIYTSFVVYGGVALGLLTTAIMMQIHGAPLTYILLLLGAFVSIFTYYLSKDETITEVVSFFNLLPIGYVLISVGNVQMAIDDVSRRGGVWIDLLVVWFATGVYYGIHKYFAGKSATLSGVALGACVIMVCIDVWQGIHLLIREPLATSLSCLVIGIGLTLFSYFFIKSEEHIKAISFANIFTLMCAVRSVFAISGSYENIANVWSEWLFLTLVIAACFVLYGFFASKVKTLAYGSLFSGSILVIVAIWEMLHTLLSSGVATFVSLLIYTVLGMFFLLQGTREKNDTKTKYSRIWLGLVAGHVIFWDAWQTGSVGSGVLICVVIGLLLLSSTLISNKGSK